MDNFSSNLIQAITELQDTGSGVLESFHNFVNSLFMLANMYALD